MSNGMEATVEKHGKFVTIKGTIVAETDKAIRFKFQDEDEVERNEWFPFSQVDELHRTDPAKLVVSIWIYGQKEKSWGHEE